MTDADALSRYGTSRPTARTVDQARVVPSGMIPPSLDVAREILQAEIKTMRTSAGFSGRRPQEIAAALEVVLASLDSRARVIQALDADLARARNEQRPAAKLPPLCQAVTRKLLIAQHPDETDDQFRDRVVQWRHAFEGEPRGEVASDSAEIAKPAPGAPRVLCGLPVEGPPGSRCFMLIGHDCPCQAEPIAPAAALNALVRKMFEVYDRPCESNGNWMHATELESIEAEVRAMVGAPPRPATR